VYGVSAEQNKTFRGTDIERAGTDPMIHDARIWLLLVAKEAANDIRDHAMLAEVDHARFGLLVFVVALRSIIEHATSCSAHTCTSVPSPLERLGWGAH
jgi:hypothetical protein